MPAMRFHPDSTEPVTKDENRVSKKLKSRTSRTDSICKVQQNRQYLQRAAQSSKPASLPYNHLQFGLARFWSPVASASPQCGTET